MEHLVDLSFRYEDRLELVRSVCNPGSTFSKYLNLNPVILLSTLPGPYIPKVFLPEDSVFYFRRLDKFRPFSPGVFNSLRFKYYNHGLPVFIQDIAQWFHSAVVQELYDLPVFVGEDSEAYKTCIRHFPLPYPKPSRDDVFSLTLDRLYDVVSDIDVSDNVSVEQEQTEESMEEPGEEQSQVENEVQAEPQPPATTETQTDSEGRQQVHVTKETKQNLDSIFRKINKGEF